MLNYFKHTIYTVHNQRVEMYYVFLIFVYYLISLFFT